MKNLTLLVLFVSILSGMDDNYFSDLVVNYSPLNGREIELENNQYQMENICFNSRSVSDSEKSFQRYYKFTFKSKYNVFENYDEANSESIHIETYLHTINTINTRNLVPIQDFLYSNNLVVPKISQNKKTIEIVLHEHDMKKLYESDSVKIIFDSNIFNYDYTGSKDISITLDKSDFHKEQAKCTEKENEYNKEYEEYHSKPLNRIKTFFDL